MRFRRAMPLITVGSKRLGLSPSFSQCLSAILPDGAAVATRGYWGLTAFLRQDRAFLRVDRDDAPTVLEVLFLMVDWPFLPREGEGVEILEDYEA